MAGMTPWRRSPHDPDDTPDREGFEGARGTRRGGGGLHRERLSCPGDETRGDAADPASRHSRTSWRGRCESGLCPRNRGLRDQDQPGFLRQSKDRAAQHQRHDGADVEPHRPGSGAAARQWLPDRHADGRGRRGRRQISIAHGRGHCRDLRRRHAIAPAVEGADAGAADPRGADLGAGQCKGESAGG